MPHFAPARNQMPDCFATHPAGVSTTTPVFAGKCLAFPVIAG